MRKLNDDVLQAVSGGFMETADLPTKNKEIVCPKCGHDKFILPSVYFDPKLNSVEYTCSKHGPFYCIGENVLSEDDFKSTLGQKGYDYFHK